MTTIATLIERSANVNAANANKSAPLYLAAMKGHYEAVQVLLASQALVNQPVRCRTYSGGEGGGGGGGGGGGD